MYCLCCLFLCFNYWCCYSVYDMSGLCDSHEL